MSLVDLRDVFVVHPSEDGGVAALRGMTLSVDEGEICVVLGPSGAGKSTLVRVVAGLQRPSAGLALVDGLDLGAARASAVARHRARVVGYADQHYWRALSADLTAEELVALPLGLRGVSREERARRAGELLERVGLLDRATARPGELSGGEQQRIAICAALAHRPTLLVADEPTGELDEATAHGVLDLLRELARDAGAAALVVSHDPESAEIADRVVQVRDGRVGEERLADRQTIVIGRGGWLHVPEESLREAGIGDRAVVHVRPGAVELRPTDHDAPAFVQELEAPLTAAGAVVEARAVSRRFGTEVALEHLDAVFRPGMLTVVTGPSGSGKSTLLALLAGLDTPDEGEIVIGDVVLSKLDRDARAAFRREEIGVVGQVPGLSSALTARENVELSLALRGLEGVELHERTIDSLAIVGLADHADRPVARLSAGERERVALARAIAARPSLLVADEPTARLDSVTTLAIGGLLADLAREHGTTVVCATHDPLVIALAGFELELGGAAAVRSG
ncbi:MAG TPA: ATP-binding cassette domain-containing protein [Gaiella sp.]|nr:ATP-binding cassette domain-containing protein [Gaiella sp.]